MPGPFLKGPFASPEPNENVALHERKKPRRPIDHEANRREIDAYFRARLERLKIVKTTVTPRGQTIDWIPIESQHPEGRIATPPPPLEPLSSGTGPGEGEEQIAMAELEARDVERGPKGTVPILRKKLDALGYTRN